MQGAQVAAWDRGEGPRTTPTQQDGVDVVQRGIFVWFANDVVFGYCEGGFADVVVLGEVGCAAEEEEFEEAAVRAVFLLGVADGSVAFEDGDAEVRADHCWCPGVVSVWAGLASGVRQQVSLGSRWECCGSKSSVMSLRAVWNGSRPCGGVHMVATRRT